jgi:glycolate oxidase iron-sulfur subunit
METHLADFIRDTPEGREAEAILRACVHCGFCTATCPTYQLLGDELDGPRGRIYLIKGMLEGETPTAITAQHLDRCLSCRACETTCPSGVRYARLADIGRAVVERQVPRLWHARLQRAAIRWLFTHPWRLRLVLGLLRSLRPLLPMSIARKLPRYRRLSPQPAVHHPRRMLALGGCVQSVATPATNAALTRVLDRLGYGTESIPGCCGALAWHTGAQDLGRERMRRLIARVEDGLQAGAEGLVVTASGCAAMIAEYPDVFRHEPAWAGRAERVAATLRDPSDLVAPAAERWTGTGAGRRIAFHAPCTLQHALHRATAVEAILARAGYQLTPVPEAHLCCGSAGSYSLTQPEISAALRERKLAALSSGAPTLIATANVGCELHLAAGASVPVRHWLELLEPGEAENKDR